MLFEGTLHFTEVEEYGISFQDLLSGQVNLPPAGARFDVKYAGSLSGPRLNGTISGTDYIYIRADGRVQLHIHGGFTASDGAKISVFAEAVGARKEGTNLFQVRENVMLFSSFSPYNWVNGLAVWSEIVIMPETGQIKIKAFAL